MRRVAVVLVAVGFVTWMSAEAVWAQVMLIKMATAPAVDHIPIFAGIEKGFFAKHCLDGRVSLQPTGVEIINQLFGSGQDVGVLGSLPFLSSVSNGLPIIIIALRNHDVDAIAIWEPCASAAVTQVPGAVRMSSGKYGGAMTSEPFPRRRR